MKWFKRVLAIALAIEVVVILVSSFQIKALRQERLEKAADRWFNQYSLVAHGMGGIQEYDYTNSREAFESQYKQGTRVFEVDLALTSDEKLVLTHGWKEHKELRLGLENADRAPMSYDEFMSQKIYGQFTPLSAEDLIKIMQEYPDIYIVLDWGKDLDYVEEEDKDYIFELDELIKRNELLINQVKAVDETLLDRIVPQIYYEEHFYALNKLHHFENYIYTLYKNYENTTAKEVMDFADKNEIDVIVSNLYGDQAILTAEIKRQINYDRMRSLEMGIFLHTINDIEATSEYIESGYKGIFTDYLTQRQLNEALSNNE